jgi:hypothetical protein
VVDDGLDRIDLMDNIDRQERLWVEDRRLKAPLDSYDYDWRGRW